MNNYGFIRTAAAVPAIRLADTEANTKEICRLIEEAAGKEVSLLVFPELSLTGATCGDLYHQETLLKGAEKGIREILEFTTGKEICVVAGAPVRCLGRLYNCAVVIRGGQLLGIVPKIYGNNGTPFCTEAISRTAYEMRYADQFCMFASAQLFDMGEFTFAVELGDDLWAPVPPSASHAIVGAHIIANLSASTLQRPTPATYILLQDLESRQQTLSMRAQHPSGKTATVLLKTRDSVVSLRSSLQTLTANDSTACAQTAAFSVKARP